MNRAIHLTLADLQEEAAMARNDLEVLERVAWHLDEMRGNSVPRDLFIRLRGGSQDRRPWQVNVYAEAGAVQDHHRDDRGGRRGAVKSVAAESFTVSAVRAPWAGEMEAA